MGDIALRCSKCGADAPAEARFCPRCGTVIHTRRSEIPESHASVKKTGILAGIVGVLLVAVVVLILLLIKQGERVMEVRPLPNPAQSPVLHADVQPPEKENPPPEIVAYLDHLKQTETMRVAMRNDFGPALQMLRQVQEMRSGFDEDSEQQTQQEIAEGIEEYRKKWENILQYFDSVIPPAACTQLSGAYKTALGKYAATMIDIQYALYNQDLGALSQMRGTAQAELDTLLVSADNELADVCRNYGIVKSYSITPDKGVDTLLSPGL